MDLIRFRAKLSSNFTELASGIIRIRMYFLAGWWFSQRIWMTMKEANNEKVTIYAIGRATERAE